ncbi:MAG TPA: OmpA family protein [Thermodesulfovibrionales bacterium]|nr:OmpA family protein [Thermodesulfovibrionales bacterium]
MRKRRQRDDDHTDRWVVSYADFITLLFAFFTVMYAISHVDTGKLERFAGSMRSAFRATGSGELNTNIIEGIRPIPYEDMQLEKDIRSTLENFVTIPGVTVSRDKRGVRISLGDSVLFDSGTAEIREEAKPLLQSVASVLKRTENAVVIEGHSDNVPVRGGKNASNWELSTARATSVLMALLADHTINPARFSAAGYGEYRPVVSNVTPEGRAKNRRVDIIFVSAKHGTP